MNKRYKATLAALATTALISIGSGAALAQQYDIDIWFVGGDSDSYRGEAIEIAADFLQREAAVRGEDLSINVVTKSFSGWEEMKQGVTLAAEAGAAPAIVAAGHEDIAPWAQSGLIVPIEDYIDVDAWPVNDIYPNLLEIASFDGQLYGLPQDAESRPFFFWKDYMREIGYSDADIDGLPDLIQSGGYTLQDVLADAKKIQDAGLVAEGYGFYPRVSNGPDYWQFYTSFGGTIENDEGKLVFDKEAMTGFYQFFVDAVELGVTRKNHLGTPWDQWYAEVANGKAGLWHGGTWHYARYTGKEGQDDFFGNIQFSLIPAGNAGGQPNTLTHPVVYLLTQQENDDAIAIAADLVKIASEPRINALHAIKSAHLGITKAESSVDLYAGDRWAREATERLLPFATAMPNNVNFGQYWEIMFGGLEASWTGQKTVAAAIADVETELATTLGDDIVIR
ncbi:extracellular solute-binding protein [Candidatus Halocynthiibacter alkanivorans]|jgi:inositol-phosphate transport system substrate-binding protein|uniref:extracellular solute-binding protein n=1 Tax=Candidatus Halocynthiibacter alkanivorans TaxID=2267619 RepID=UPI000DF224FC|nr:extracellular solute-binding protein [Candidatus Halocynthiibacter alkanivorans]